MYEIHQCECATCQNGTDAQQQHIHQQINMLVSRLDEQQRRWYAALEAQRYGHGGITRFSKITGLDEKTISRGARELDADLRGRPTVEEGRVRLPGGGRKPTKKKGSRRTT